MDGEVTVPGKPGLSLPVGLFLLALLAGCGRTPESRRAEFHAADLNHDDAVSVEEFDKAHSQRDAERRKSVFEKADANHDQQLSPVEYLEVRFTRHPLLWALGIFSIVSFVGSLVAIPVVVARLPVNHFVAPHEAADWVTSDIRRRLWLVVKNLLGLVLIVGGAVMLILPGQGVLTILLGIALTDFPGKWRLMRALAHRPNVMKALNWMREKAHQPPLLAPPPYHEPPPAG